MRWHTSGTKHYHHRVVGDLTLAYEAMQLAADPGQTLSTFTAEPGSPSQQALTFPASWATSPAQRACGRRGTSFRSERVGVESPRRTPPRGAR